MPRLKKHYLVISCTGCNRLLLAASDKKTRTCPYCGEHVKMADARTIFQSENPNEAREALREAKVKINGSISAGREHSR